MSMKSMNRSSECLKHFNITNFAQLRLSRQVVRIAATSFLDDQLRVIENKAAHDSQAKIQRDVEDDLGAEEHIRKRHPEQRRQEGFHGRGRIDGRDDGRGAHGGVP